MKMESRRKRETGTSDGNFILVATALAGKLHVCTACRARNETGSPRRMQKLCYVWLFFYVFLKSSSVYVLVPLSILFLAFLKSSSVVVNLGFVNLLCK